VLISGVFHAISLNDLIANMYVQKDVETALISFHLANMFSNFSQMHSEILLRKRDITDAIMQCLRDRDLTPAQKK
jgi:hypothetical protein